jgi:hypothetical protein
MDMDYYKLIEWNNVDIDKILSIIDSPNYLREQVIPLTIEKQLEIFKVLKIDVELCTAYRIMLVYMPPNSRISIHSDKPRETNEPGKLHRCIILPLVSCEQLIWTWYEPTDPSQIFYYGETGNWKTVPMIPDAYARALDTIVCDKPFLSDIGTFHALRNNSDKPAIAISIRVMPWSWETLNTEPSMPPVNEITLK